MKPVTLVGCKLKVENNTTEEREIVLFGIGDHLPKHRTPSDENIKISVLEDHDNLFETVWHMGVRNYCLYFKAYFEGKQSTLLGHIEQNKPIELFTIHHDIHPDWMKQYPGFCSSYHSIIPNTWRINDNWVYVISSCTANPLTAYINGCIFITTSDTTLQFKLAGKTSVVIEIVLGRR